MTENDELCEFVIAVSDFDLNLIPEEARSPGTEKFEAAVKNYFEDQLRLIAAGYTVSIEDGSVRVTWRKDSVRPDALDEAVAALQRGDYVSGVQILEFLAPSRFNDAMVHYNLGMAYSDLGKLDKAIDHLQRALKIDSGMINAKVALGVAYTRQKKYEDSAAILKDAVLNDPDNGYALRNLGAVLLQLGRDKDDSLRYLRRAVEMLPEDQQAWFGLAQAQMKTGHSEDADSSLIKTIELQPYSPIADMAKEVRSRIAQENFRSMPGGSLRMDGAMYCLGALRKFSQMTPEEVRNVGFEIVTLGMNGINVNDPKTEYHLRTLPGNFSGLQLLCYEYVAFKQFAPEMDIGFDLAKEYEEAMKMNAMGL